MCLHLCIGQRNSFQVDFDLKVGELLTVLLEIAERSHDAPLARDCTLPFALIPLDSAACQSRIVPLQLSDKVVTVIVETLFELD